MFPLHSRLDKGGAEPQDLVRYFRLAVVDGVEVATTIEADEAEVSSLVSSKSVVREGSDVAADALGLATEVEVAVTIEADEAGVSSLASSNSVVREGSDVAVDALGLATEVAVGSELEDAEVTVLFETREENHSIIPWWSSST